MNKFQIGDTVTVKVTGIANYGIFTQLPDGAQGLIHISEISEGYVRDCSLFATVGSFIEVTVVGYGDRDNYKLSPKRQSKRARQNLRGPIKPPLRRETNRQKLNSIPFEPLQEALESQIDKEYDRLMEAQQHD